MFYFLPSALSQREHPSLYWNLPITTVTDSTLAERDASADTIFIRPCPSVPFTHTHQHKIMGLSRGWYCLSGRGGGWLTPTALLNQSPGSTLQWLAAHWTIRMAHISIKSPPPAVNHNQGHYKTGDNKTKLMQRETKCSKCHRGETVSDGKEDKDAFTRLNLLRM